MKLRPQMWVDLKKNDQIVQCPACSRVLFYEPPIPEVHPPL
jgi:predicted  nucleic acid-binding Zn-ribbon protein